MTLDQQSLFCVNTLIRLKGTSSTNEKKLIIKEAYGNNPDFWEEFWNLMLGYKFSFGIKKIDTERPPQVSQRFHDVVSILAPMRMLAQFNTSGALGRAMAYDIANTQSFEYPQDIALTYVRLEHKDMLKRIVFRELRIGVDAVLVNKATGKNIVDVFPVMLAAKAKDKIQYPCFIEPKYDGVRCIAIPSDNGSYKLYTRNGKLIDGFSEIERNLVFYADTARINIAKNLNNLLKNRNIVFDGEIIGSSYRDTMENLFTQEQNKVATFVVWDAIDFADFAEVESKRVITRLSHISKRENVFDEMYFDEIDEEVDTTYDTSVIRTVQSLFCQSAETMEHLHAINKTKFEGSIIKHQYGAYEYKRSLNWIKLKDMFTYDFTVVDIKEGGGKYENRVGALVVEYFFTSDDKLTESFEFGATSDTFEVGSGLSDAQREEWWFNPQSIIGKTIEVRFQELHPDTNKPRFGVLLSVREDK